MIQSEIETKLDPRTRIGSAFTGEEPDQPQQDGALPKKARNPLFYAAAVSTVWVLRKEIFGIGGLLFAAGFLAARQVKTGQLPAILKSKFGGLVEDQATFTINRSPQDLYDMWHAVENSPKWMESVRSVQKTGDKTSHWVMDLPGGQTLEWDAEWTAEEPAQRLAWRTIGDPQVPSAGQISFEAAASGRGTVVRVNQQLVIPGGRLASVLGGLFSRTTGGYVRENLRHFKQLAEAGEVATTKGQPTGTRGAATAIAQALHGDREQQTTSPWTGAIEHAEVA